MTLPVVAFLAFFLKGIAGIGVSTVAVPILSLIIGAKQIVVLSSIVNVVGGLLMYRIDPQPAERRYWWPIAISMIIGAVLGGQTANTASNLVIRRQHLVRTELDRTAELFLAPRGHDHPRPEQLGKLQAGHRHAAADAMNEHRFAGAQSPPVDQHPPRGKMGEAESRRLSPREVIGARRE